MHPTDIIAIIAVLSAFLGYINHRLLGLPHVIGLTVMGAAVCLSVVAADELLPSLHLGDPVRQMMDKIDFEHALMGGMLSVLLFAGALHTDLRALLERKIVVGLMATVGVLISTVLVAVGVHAVAPLLGSHIDMTWALVFGALISPTDPVAVMKVLRAAKVPPAIEAKIAGESLFNDGVGVVLFVILLSAADNNTTTFTLGHAVQLFLVQAVGGVAYGFAIGWLAYQVIKKIDYSELEILISLALVLGGYAMAERLGVSGPVAMVVAGLMFGNHTTKHAMSKVTRDDVRKFWSLLDMLMNSALFLLIGLEIIAVPFGRGDLLLGLAAIPLALFARAISVALPTGILGLFTPTQRGTFPILVWGGLRGGISIALALSLPPGPTQETILTATYMVVMFSVIVQGATVGKLALRYGEA